MVLCLGSTYVIDFIDFVGVNRRRNLLDCSGFTVSVLKAWRRPTLPRLKTQYHRR